MINKDGFSWVSVTYNSYTPDKYRDWKGVGVIKAQDERLLTEVMEHFKTEDLGDPGKTSNWIPFQTNMATNCQLLLGRWRKNVGLFYARSQTQAARWPGYGFFQTAFVCENQLVQQPIIIEVTSSRITCDVSNLGSLCSSSAMWLWRQYHWLDCHVTKSQPQVYSEWWHCVRGKNVGVEKAFKVDSTSYSLTQSPLCARVKGVTSVLEPWDANSSYGDRANSLGLGLISTKC